MSIREELEALGAPSKVLEAGTMIDQAVIARSFVPYWLQAYVREWVIRNMRNNRYGK